ncbi:MAG: zinc ribbon domain-containing protein [bacterium]|nr:zinc ribbon domain-containing protein [bacterium]
MPFFDYECKDCGDTFDKLVSTDGDEAVECPICGSKETMKLVSLFASFGASNSDAGGCVNFG